MYLHMTKREKEMPQCVTCGRELHPERAQKYNYCMARECQEKNAKGLAMVAVGVNKAAEQYMILDDRTREELASGKYHDQRRVHSGRRPGSLVPRRLLARLALPARPAVRPRRPPARPAAKRPVARGVSHRRNWRCCITSNGSGQTR